MEVATDGIYFIIYVTYIIVTTTCFALSSVLYLTKGIKTPLSNNKGSPDKPGGIKHIAL